MKRQSKNLQLFADTDGDCGAVISEISGTTDGSAAPTAVISADGTETADDMRVAQIAKALGVEGDADAVLAFISGEKMRLDIERRIEEERLKSANEKIISEAELLSEKIEDFDIEKELCNKKFAAMLNSGLTVEEAFCAVHYKELLENAVGAARENAWKDALAELRPISDRPYENGASGQAAAAGGRNVENLNGKSIREILHRVEKGAKIKF